MLRLDLNRIFRVKGIGKKNSYLVSRGHSSTYASHLVNNQVVSISFAKMEDLCRDFNCTPNDLFDFVPEKDSTLPEGHALWSLRKSDKIEEVNKLLNELPMERIEELYRVLKKGEGDV